MRSPHRFELTAVDLIGLVTPVLCFAVMAFYSTFIAPKFAGWSFYVSSPTPSTHFVTSNWMPVAAAAIPMFVAGVALAISRSARVLRSGLGLACLLSFALVVFVYVGLTEKP